MTIIAKASAYGVLRIEGDVSVDEIRDVDCDEIGNSEGLGRRVGGEGVPEQQHHQAKERRGHDRQAHVPPELEGAGTEVRRRLPPLLAQALDHRDHEQDHEGQLEVHVDERAAEQSLEAERWVDVQT